MQREAKILLDKSVDSLVLAVDHFNCPWDRGRQEAAIILLDRAFELFMKAVILHRGGKIREPRATETIGFDKCVRKLLTDEKLKSFTEEEALIVQVANSLRDAAQHYILELSEDLFYIVTQSGVSLFAEKLESVFKRKLSDHVPERVLPISARPPRSMEVVISDDIKNIRELSKPKSRRRLHALACLRPLAIIEASLAGVRAQPSEGELVRDLRKLQGDKDWRNVFPGVAAIRLANDDDGYRVSLRITKNEGEAIRLVPEGTQGATVVAIKRVNELSYYSMNLTSLAAKLGLSVPKALTLVKHFKIQESDEYFKEIAIESIRSKRYSQKALDELKKLMPSVDMNSVWEEHKPSGKAVAPHG